MLEVWDTLLQFLWLAFRLVMAVLRFAVPWLPVLAWVAWWLWGVNWRRLWPTLRQGAWAPILLLAFLVALVWTFVSPGPYTLLGLTLPGFWWQAAAVVLLLVLAACCGWVQVVYGWCPQEAPLQVAPAQSQEHHHDHGTASH